MQRPETGSVVVGVDTHEEIHVAAVVDHDGNLLDESAFPTTRQGYRMLERRASSFGEICRVGIECSGSYGSGLMRHLLKSGMSVYYKGTYGGDKYLKGLEAERSEANKSLNNIIRAIEKGAFSDALQRRLAELEARLRALDDAIDAEKAKVALMEDTHGISAYFQRYAHANLDDPNVRDEVLEYFIDKIYLNDDRLVIVGDFVEYSGGNGRYEFDRTIGGYNVSFDIDHDVGSPVRDLEFDCFAHASTMQRLAPVRAACRGLFIERTTRVFRSQDMSMTADTTNTVDGRNALRNTAHNVLYMVANSDAFSLPQAGMVGALKGGLAVLDVIVLNKRPSKRSLEQKTRPNAHASALASVARRMLTHGDVPLTCGSLLGNNRVTYHLFWWCAVWTNAA